MQAVNAAGLTWRRGLAGIAAGLLCTSLVVGCGTSSQPIGTNYPTYGNAVPSGPSTDQPNAMQQFNDQQRQKQAIWFQNEPATGDGNGTYFNNQIMGGDNGPTTGFTPNDGSPSSDNSDSSSQ